MVLLLTARAAIASMMTTMEFSPALVAQLATSSDSMIPKSGSRFSEEIMLKKLDRDHCPLARMNSR
jgi:hypothetical protein